jgi:NTE family protein
VAAARAAYQVGFLRCLARHFPNLNIPLLTGVSAGAINAAFLTNHRGAFAEAVGDLAEMWRGLTIDQVFGVDTWNLAKIVIRWGVSLAFGGLGLSPSVRGLVDTGPLHKLLQKRLASSSGILPGVGENLRQ